MQRTRRKRHWSNWSLCKSDGEISRKKSDATQLSPPSLGGLETPYKKNKDKYIYIYRYICAGIFVNLMGVGFVDRVKIIVLVKFEFTVQDWVRLVAYLIFFFKSTIKL